MSVESVDKAARTPSDSASSERRPLGDVCGGCRELEERVERLERHLLEKVAEVSTPALSTTGCYWICVSVHAFVTFSLCSNELGIQFGMLVIAGAVGTLAVCHVFSTRPIHVRIMRSLLSMAIVGGSALVAVSQGNLSTASDLLPAVQIYLPLLAGSAWFVAKLFVWTRGWMLVPPNGASEFPKLRIWHLFLATLVAAVYLAIGRVLIDDTDVFLGGEMMLLVLYITFPTAVCTVFACVLARIILQPPNPKKVLQATLLGTSAFALAALGWGVLILISGDADSIVELSLMVAFYAPLAALGVFASPGFTFLMLRTAKYRFVIPGQSA